MTNVVHLEPKEFVEKLSAQHKQIYARPYVLDNGIAGLVYMFDGKDSNVYYLDRMYAPRQQEVDQIDFYTLHAELYRKVALDARLTH
ncbi:hypothetical protein [Catenisphaera adipataccumulans]|jgi:hypothetical protein|uniref:Uncharacterized protein n=1 Tax=Catenisphaera adipataccumulans TaxID=700500 RepID=A0A7W8CYP1_9FIRM|nr:hypothetical protein [Catenisphaera adipataccumulans]MBB5183404.1 hypothetical protein [Catenisphaera adipataccumulans]